MSPIRLFAGIIIACSFGLTACGAEELLFEDTFDKQLSDKWEIGLSKDDYRIRNGALEIRVQPGELDNKTPMLKVKLPFRTADSVIASVEVTIVDQPLARHEFAGLSLLDSEGLSFSVRKENIDGHFLLAPGNVDFLGKAGEEGDPAKYSVKYWPADKAAGPLRIIVRDDYAHFQVGPSTEGKYQTFFHSAIGKNDAGNGFSLMAAGSSGNTAHWVRFDNFRIVRN
jgi:hypothetical protein